MKPISMIGIIFTVGVFIFLKIFQESIPRINEPVTNIIVFLGFVLFAIMYGLTHSRRNKN